VLAGGHYSGLRKTVVLSNNSILRSLWWKWMTGQITSSFSFPLHMNSTLIIEGFKSILHLAVAMLCVLLCRVSLGKGTPRMLMTPNSSGSGEQFCKWGKLQLLGDCCVAHLCSTMLDRDWIIKQIMGLRRMSSAQEVHGHVGAGPEEGHKNDPRAGTPLL